MKHEIHITEEVRHIGLIRGTVDDYLFVCEVSDEEVEDGLRSSDLKSGLSRIVKICIYEDETMPITNPFLPSLGVKRKIYIDFYKEWIVFNMTLFNTLYELLGYIERRLQMRVSKDD